MHNVKGAGHLVVAAVAPLGGKLGRDAPGPWRSVGRARPPGGQGRGVRGDSVPRMTLPDVHRLQRFEVAQDQGRTYEAAVAELRAGTKASHWMWFIFPQISGLGQSSMSKTYAISSRAEAQAYLAHPVLGPRLLGCVDILLELTGRSAQDIFGSTDAMKLRSSMTLFARAAPESPGFREVLDRYFGGVADPATEDRLGSGDR